MKSYSTKISKLSCDDEYDPTLILVDTALERIAQATSPLVDTEIVPIRDSLGRVLACDLRSPMNIPNHTNSAMDGYAIKHVDPIQNKLQIIGTAWAGKPFNGVVGNNECVRIMTGAVLPENCNTVIMKEHVEADGEYISFSKNIKVGQNVRYAGEDIVSGDTALPSGKYIEASDVGIAASLGVSELSVIRRPKVAFFSNGDELRSIGQPLDLGNVYDSNRYTLHSMLRQCGASIFDLGVVSDDRNKIKQAFLKASELADIVITSAGASVGEADYVKDVLDEIGVVNFWKIAMKPGRPLSFGKINDSLFFGLPGNPVSVMVTFYQFVLPCLRRLSGRNFWHRFQLTAVTIDQLKKRPGRTEYQRGVLSQDENGSLQVSTTGEQGSGILSSMSRANCFIILPLESSGSEPGDIVSVQPFSDFL